MVYKITLKEGFSNHIKEIRDLHGDYNQEVFFWDILLSWEYEDIESLKADLEVKVSPEDMDKIKIVEGYL